MDCSPASVFWRALMGRTWTGAIGAHDKQWRRLTGEMDSLKPAAFTIAGSVETLRRSCVA